MLAALATKYRESRTAKTRGRTPASFDTRWRAPNAARPAEGSLAALSELLQEALHRAGAIPVQHP